MSDGLQRRLARLREVLHREPSWRAWFDLGRLLSDWPEDDSRALALEYVAEHQEGWPEALRGPLLDGLDELESHFDELLEGLKADGEERRSAVTRSTALLAEASGDRAGLGLFIWSHRDVLVATGREGAAQCARWEAEDSPVAWVAAKREEGAQALRPTRVPATTTRAAVGTCAASLTTGIAPPQGWTQGDVAFAMHPDGDQLFVGGNEGVEAWSLRRAAQTLDLKRPEARRTRGIAVHPEGRWMVTAGGAPRLFGFYSRNSPRSANLLTLWDLSARKVQARVEARCPLAGPVRFHPDGRRVVVLGEYDLAVWDMDTRRWSQPFRRPESGYGQTYYRWMHLTPDGREVWTARYHHTQGDCPFDELERWDLETGADPVVEVQTDLHHPAFLTTVPFPDGRLLSSRELTVWDLDPPAPRDALRARLSASPSQEVEPIGVVEGGDFAVLEYGRAYHLVELETGRDVCALGPSTRRAALLPGDRLAMLYFDRRLVVRDLTPILTAARGGRSGRGRRDGAWSLSSYGHLGHDAPERAAFSVASFDLNEEAEEALSEPLQDRLIDFNRCVVAPERGLVALFDHHGFVVEVWRPDGAAPLTRWVHHAPIEECGADEEGIAVATRQELTRLVMG